MNIETFAGGPPTSGESFAKMIHHIREAQEQAAILAHLANANDDKTMALGWLAVTEQFKKMVHIVTKMAMGKMQ
jgi:3-dehydroquinate dehydratase